MKLKGLRIGLLLLFPGWLGASEMSPLRQNGAQFVLASKRYPIHCLDKPALLSMRAGEVSKVFGRASRTGFNAISFEMPLFGQGGLVGRDKKVNSKVVENLHYLLEMAQRDKIYLFPVLWNPASVQALVKAVGGDTRYFWAYKRHMQWQAWLLGQLAQQGRLAGNTAVGGLILYRGPWPGPYPEGSVINTTREKEKNMLFTKWMARWAAWQVRVANKVGLRQSKGMGFWFVGDLPKIRTAMDLDEGVLNVDGSAAAPLPQLLNVGEEPELIDSAQLDILPPVPGEEKILNKKGKPAFEPASTQIEWKAFSQAYSQIPLGSWLDFMEVTFDTEDWHRVADKFSEIAEKDLEVPLLWRHDWRACSPYERGKRLELEGLAGLEGPWPENAWANKNPRVFSALELDPSTPKNLALKFLQLSFKQNQGQWELSCRTNRPSVLKVKWGLQLPIKHSASRLDKSLIHHVKLLGAKKGDQLLLSVRAESNRWGRAVVRTRRIHLAETSKRKK